MAHYRFTYHQRALITDLNGAELDPGQEFDPSEFGVPDWRPSPDPHPLFKEIIASAPAPKFAPAQAPSEE